MPRSLDEQRRWLADRSGAHAVVVAEDGGDIVGFGSLSPYRDRPAYSTSVEDSVYVHRDHQGEGIGKLCSASSSHVATKHGFHTMFARIVGGHEASIALHRALGLRESSARSARSAGKFGRWLDVIVMQRCCDRVSPLTAGNEVTRRASSQGGPGRIRTSVARATGLQPVPFGRSGTDP